ncbi:putative glycoside hydrolase [Acetivibrio straminisolvens]|uniref:Glycoside hydrolase n=1 Tax=Acetivibrio straminisolvens JCM 21531 TaxID=1294263 RepID=W4VCS9_9FIRM|nr:putative glycoside hydrolase [Acetivibrio straminisolvens]GAE90603.1 glycoside hydrolase [Acetivibrio straminisolvens JCM 21531]
MFKNRRLLMTLVAFLAVFATAYAFIYYSDSSNRKSKKIDENGNIQLGHSSTNENGNNENINKEEIPPSPQPKREPVKVKGLYITGTSAGNKKFMEKLINLINTTELNTVVLDIKEDGKVNYLSGLESVMRIGAYHELYNVDEVIKLLHDNNIYVIGRIVCFRDNYLAGKRVDLAIKRKDGTIWRENGSIAWTNPYNKEVWKYNIDIAKEAVSKGFDEIQFDYVRFPAAGKNEVDYGENPLSKADAISGFLKEAANEINKMGAPVSADIFAIVCETPGDTEGIGQVLERVGMDVDYISPMIYPSHYANASHGMMGNGKGQSINGILFTAPDLKPYEVVYNVLLKTKDRISKVEGYRAKVRPYLQDFTASYLPKGYYQHYGPEQIRQQIKAVYDAGYEEWIFWNAANTYTESAFSRK